LYINHHIHWRQNKIFRDGRLLHEVKETALPEIAEVVYKREQISYPKFFKMDLLSRVAFLATELLNPDYSSIEKEKIAVVLSTYSGCLEVDKKFEESRKDFASPALFVYTLPNIMLGEICIRNGFKGEQMCRVEEQFNPDWFVFYVSDLLNNRETDACLFGHVEAIISKIEVDLFWVSKTGGRAKEMAFNKENLMRIFRNH